MVSRSRSTRRSSSKPTSRRRNARRSIRPSLMVLEPRTLLATLTVSNTNDSGGGSLRALIGQASAGDLIVFDPALFNQGARTISLTSGALSLTKNLNIQGPGAPMLTIDAKNASQVLTVQAGTSAGVSDLTL